MKVIKSSIPIFFLAFLVVACKKESYPEPRSAKQDGLWPMNLQNEWTYRRTFYNADGTKASFSEEKTSITDTFTVRGQLYFKDELTGLSLTNAGENLVRGLGVDSSLTDPYAIVFQRVFKDDSVIWRLDDPSCNSNISFRGYTGTTLVNGHACLRNERVVKSCDGKITGKNVYYLNPGLGLVKHEEYVLYPGMPAVFLRVGVELVSYKLN